MESEKNEEASSVNFSSSLKPARIDHPLSFRTPIMMSLVVNTSIVLSSMDNDNSDLVDKFKQLANKLLDGWKGHSTAAEYPGRWHNLIVAIHRDFVGMIQAYPLNAAELADALCLLLFHLIDCMVGEAINYRPKPYDPAQDRFEWQETCEQERKGAIVNVLYGHFTPDPAGTITLLHRRRLRAIISLYQVVRAVYDSKLPVQFERTTDLLPDFYYALPAEECQPLVNGATPPTADLPTQLANAPQAISPPKHLFSNKFTRDECEAVLVGANIIFDREQGYGLCKPNAPAQFWGAVQALVNNRLMIGEVRLTFDKLADLYAPTVGRNTDYKEQIKGNPNRSLRDGRIQTEMALIEAGKLKRQHAFYHVEADKKMIAPIPGNGQVTAK